MCPGRFVRPDCCTESGVGCPTMCPRPFRYHPIRIHDLERWFRLQSVTTSNHSYNAIGPRTGCFQKGRGLDCWAMDSDLERGHRKIASMWVTQKYHRSTESSRAPDCLQESACPARSARPGCCTETGTDCPTRCRQLFRFHPIRIHDLERLLRLRTVTTSNHSYTAIGPRMDSFLLDRGSGQGCWATDLERGHRTSCSALATQRSHHSTESCRGPDYLQESACPARFARPSYCTGTGTDCPTMYQQWFHFHPIRIRVPECLSHWLTTTTPNRNCTATGPKTDSAQLRRGWQKEQPSSRRKPQSF